MKVKGTVWRLTSDEGAILKGSDLAPFPLAFYNAGLHSDFVKRALQIARSKEITLAIDSVNITNQYYFRDLSLVVLEKAVLRP